MREPVSSEQLADQQEAAAAFAHVSAVMARLRGPEGCAWDREQTLDSIKPHTLEEVYEVFDAIDRRDWANLQDELGDLLLQVLFYAQIAQDEGKFAIADVARGLGAKLLRRHPHVFGDAHAATADDVVRTWDAVKRSEKSAKTGDGLLSQVDRNLPAFTEARKLGKAAARIGFDWTDVQGLFDKVREEVRELESELPVAAATQHPERELLAERQEEEFGDLLFVLASVGRHLHIDPEQALRKANAKFRRRFGAMERLANGSEALAAKTPAQMEALWAQAKAEERAS